MPFQVARALEYLAAVRADEAFLWFECLQRSASPRTLVVQHSLGHSVQTRVAGNQKCVQRSVVVLGHHVVVELSIRFARKRVGAAGRLDRRREQLPYPGVGHTLGWAAEIFHTVHVCVVLSWYSGHPGLAVSL